MKPILASRALLIIVSLASIFAVGCGSKPEEAETPKGAAQRSDVQAVSAGGGQQNMSSMQRPSFDNTK